VARPCAIARATTIADFNNLDLAGFVATDTGGGTCEWIDAATKGFAGNASDLVTNLTFAYCSVVLDPASGGPGGSVLLGFYEGYTVGGPAPTTSVALFNLTGLPGNTGSSSYTALTQFTGSVLCYWFDLDLATSLSFADGPIGYSWRFVDVGTTNVLAGTFPYLSCVQSCLSSGPDAQGMVDLLDQYSPPGTLRSTFSFGSFPSGGFQFFTSISMKIGELVQTEAVATGWNGQGINTDVLSTGAIVMGGSWEAAIALGHAHGASGPTSLRVRTACINGPNLTSPTGHPFEAIDRGPAESCVDRRSRRDEPPTSSPTSPCRTILRSRASSGSRRARCSAAGAPTSRARAAARSAPSTWSPIRDGAPCPIAAAYPRRVLRFVGARRRPVADRSRPMLDGTSSTERVRTLRARSSPLRCSPHSPRCPRHRPRG
jgi:hypothetical protein